LFETPFIQILIL